VWRAEVDGLRLRFHLAGINDQNFLMRDEETGSYWQQITGAAIAGPLAGRRLTLIPSDELTFATWKAEEPHGTVLREIAVDTHLYAKKDWDVRMAKAPTVIAYPESGLAPRELMIGVHGFGASRAFRYDTLLNEKLIEDRLGPEPVLLVLGQDGHSVRVFHQRVPGVAAAPDFYRVVAGQSLAPGALLMDSATGSEWNFQGCAISGKSAGACLERVESIKDYWFDWRHFNPATTVYREKRS
jgi:hypothetical protein